MLRFQVVPNTKVAPETRDYLDGFGSDSFSEAIFFQGYGRYGLLSFSIELDENVCMNIYVTLVYLDIQVVVIFVYNPKERHPNNTNKAPIR